MSFNIGAAILGLTEKLAFSDNKRMEVASLRQRAAASGDATAVQKAKRNVRLMTSHMARKAKSTGASFGDVFVKMKSDHVQWQRGRHVSRPVLDWTNAAKVQAAKDKGQAAMKARQAAEAVTAASTAKTMAADVAANKNIRRVGAALLGATALAGGAAALHNHRRDRQQMKTAVEKLAISDELYQRALDKAVDGSAVGASRYLNLASFRRKRNSKRGNPSGYMRNVNLEIQQHDLLNKHYEKFPNDRNKSHLQFTKQTAATTKTPASVSASATKTHAVPAVAAAKARGFRGPSMKQVGVGAGIAAGVGAALYAQHRRAREKTAAIPAARFKELRGQIAGRLAHRADMVGNRLLDAHGADLLRLRAQKRRLGGMLGRAQQYEAKSGLRSAGVNTNVRNSAASLSAERSAVTGSAANAATKVTRRPATAAANDSTKVVKTPPLPAATGGADHTRTGLGWHLQKPKVRAA